MKRIHVLLIVIVCIPFVTIAQVEPDIQSRLEKIYRGEVDVVREELPTLLSRYQNHPGVLYLQGMLTIDGTEAVKIFQSVVDNFPESEWADDALYRVYQYYYSVGLYRTAEEKLNQLKREYPQSRYAFGQQPRFDRRDETAEERVEEQRPPVTRPEPAQPQQQQQDPPASRPVSQFPFSLQVGAFSTYENAMRQREMLHGLDEAVEITTRMRGGQNLYLVWVGSFRTREQAVEYGQQLRRRFNIEAMVVTR
jgi:tetratricopeptide (TPR) repeat protein